MRVSNRIAVKYGSNACACAPLTARLNADAPDELLGGLELLIERPDQELYRLVSTRDDSAVEVPSDYERLERETLNLLRASLRQV